MMQIQIKAPTDFVIVEPVYEGMAESSKIIQIHDRDKEYIGEFHGIVAAIGPDYPWELKVGDKVLFRRHEGTPIELEGKKYLSLKRQWCEAIIND